MTCNPDRNESAALLVAMDKWVQQYNCTCVDIGTETQFKAVWGLMLASAIVFCYGFTYPLFPRCCQWHRRCLRDGICCCCRCLPCCRRRHSETITRPEPETKKPEIQAPVVPKSPRQQLEDEVDDKDVPPEPNQAKAVKHLRNTSVTKNGAYYPMWRTKLGDMAEIGGTGMELYFRLLRNLGVVFAYMSVVSCASIAFNAISTFAPDNGNALAKTSIGNIGATVQGTSINPEARYIVLRDWNGICQATPVTTVTAILGWLDFSAIILFMVCVLAYRYYVVPTVTRKNDDDNITPGDFAVQIGGLPRRFEGFDDFDADHHTQYEKQLREYVCRRIQFQRDMERKRAGADATEDPCPIGVEEMVLVRDNDGRLNTKRALAAKQRELQIVSYTGPEKQRLKLENKIKKAEEKLDRVEKPEEQRDVVRCYAILSNQMDAVRLIRDHRFFEYGVFRWIFRCLSRWGYYQDIMFRGRPLYVVRAPEPSNIIWENQDVPKLERKGRCLGVAIAFFLIILLSFVLVYSANAAAKSRTTTNTQFLGNPQCDPLTVSQSGGKAEYICLVNVAANWTTDFLLDNATADEKACYCGSMGLTIIAKDPFLAKVICEDWLIALGTGVSIGVGATVIVIVINVLAKAVLIQLALAEKPLSYSALYAGQMVKIFALQTLNTGFVVFCVNFSPPDWLPLGGVIFLGEFNDSVRGWYVVVGAAIMSNMLANAVTPAATNVIVMFYNKIKRYCLRKRQKHQLRLQDLYTNPPFDMSARFAQLLNTIFVTLTYSSGMPVLNVFACFYMLFTFWADKIVLLRGSKRPPLYDTEMAKQAADIMLYAVPLHCFFAVWMLGQPCTFPSNPLGGELKALADQGRSAADKTKTGNSAAIADGASDRVMKESTWMVFALLVIVVGLWVLWMLLWILGGTLGEAIKAMMTCCPSRTRRIAPPTMADESTWATAKHVIARNCPPASYRMEEHPMYKYHAAFMTTSGSSGVRWRNLPTGRIRRSGSPHSSDSAAKESERIDIEGPDRGSVSSPCIASRDGLPD